MSADVLFRTVFGRNPAATVFVPGRVNLIGEHTDYNGGAVMPMALPLGVTIAAAPNDAFRLRIHSASFSETAEREIGDSVRGCWSDHAAGAVAHASRERRGFDIAIESDLPHGAGLSSSAAVIVAVIKAVRQLENNPVSDMDAALAAKSVENNYIGLPCGIMDQMAVSMLRPGECMLLDTKTLAFNRITPPANWVFAVHHSGVMRALNDGRYAQRRAECESAARALGVSYLCDLKSPPLSGIIDDVLYHRARHQVTENSRVLAARKAMERKDAVAFGRAMIESHLSMRDDFEITTPKVDAVVEASLAAGAAGARMTGGGFGGCIVSLISARRFNNWRERFSQTAPQAAFLVKIEGAS